jgi:rod shape-determining protein MreD
VRYAILAILVFLLLAIQTPVLRVMGLDAWGVDVGLLTVLYLAATSSPLRGFVAAWAIGFVVDSFTLGGVLGMHMEIMGIMFLVSLGLASRFHLLRPLPLIVVALVCSVMKSLLFFLFSILFDRGFTQYATVLLWALPHAAVTAVFGPLLFAVLGAVDRRVRGRRDLAGGVLR